MSTHGPLDAWRRNPFFVLGVPPTATRAELERSGQKLLALLAVGNAAAKHCETPLGPLERDADLVRNALAELRDPRTRIAHELWATLAQSPITTEPVEPGWEQATSAISVRGPWSIR
ncbi:MAG TPA: hypothetical protein VFQ35_08620 [Polyangiaceae bacterium]|nr:hypothetical protein [Polyangiaceae bacterium]